MELSYGAGRKVGSEATARAIEEWGPRIVAWALLAVSVLLVVPLNN
jgi:hypothetical protein